MIIDKAEAIVCDQQKIMKPPVYSYGSRAIQTALLYSRLEVIEKTKINKWGLIFLKSLSILGKINIIFLFR